MLTLLTYEGLSEPPRPETELSRLRFADALEIFIRLPAHGYAAVATVRQPLPVFSALVLGYLRLRDPAIQGKIV